MKFRVIIEIRWLQKLASTVEIKVPALSQEAQNYLNHIIEQFNLEDAQRIKEIDLNN